jgi:hypothetical protein
LVDALSIFFVAALPPSKDLFPVRLIPARIINTALFAAFLALASVIGNTMLAVLGAPGLEIGAAPFPLGGGYGSTQASMIPTCRPPPVPPPGPVCGVSILPAAGSFSGSDFSPFWVLCHE